jgi:outer membrane protein assembly factor BamD
MALLGLNCATARMLVRPAPTNAEELYQQSMEDLEGGLFPEALKGFADLKAQYPYTKYASLADLRTADTHFHRGKHLEAVDAYRTFLKLHPSHEEVPYAMFQIGEAYYSQIPDNWFFLPPAAEKDQGNTRLAITGYQDMLDRHPKADIATRAKERLDECRTKLAEHEMYVANFYFGREVYKASAGRAEGLLKSYGGLGFDEEALWIAGYSRKEVGENDRARQHLSQLAERFAGSSRADDAAALLHRMQPARSAVKPSPVRAAPAPKADGDIADDGAAGDAAGGDVPPVPDAEAEGAEGAEG